MSKSFSEIWEECNQAEAERNEAAFLQAITIETQSCYFCGFYNRPPLKKEPDRTFVEDIIHNELSSIPGYNPEPEHRDLILMQSKKGVWAYVCKKCTTSKKVLD